MTRYLVLLRGINVGGRNNVDGNKRLGWIAIRLFYRLSDADIQPTPDEAFDIVVSVASGDRRDVAEIAETLARWRTSTKANADGIGEGL